MISAMDFDGGRISICNSGVINGQLAALGTKFTLVNTGTIIGNVYSGSGDDTFDTEFGVITGSMAGYDGNDTYIIGAARVEIYELGSNLNSTADEVFSSVSHQLDQAVEILHLEGFGADTMTGGSFGDSFVFAATQEIGLLVGQRDVITDMQVADRIDLRGIDATAGGVDNAFVFIGTTLLGGAGHLRFEQIVADGITIVEGDVTGDAVADFRLELTGLINLTAANFLL